jgi:CRP-like cAMP-binding protein
MLTDNVLRNRTAELSLDEQVVLEGAISRTERFRAGQLVVRQGKPVTTSTLLVEGFMSRHVDTKDGRRHLVAVHVPGDFVDLHAYALKVLDHDVGALTEITVAIFPHAELERIQREGAHVARRLWFLTLLDAAMHRHWIYRLASLSAVQRVAHFVCEMNARLLAIGASDGSTFSLAMTQGDMGEVCGLTNVHISRVLRQLREQGLCTVRSAQVQIHDLKGLVSTGLFDPAYLYLSRQTALRATGQPESSHD